MVSEIFSTIGDAVTGMATSIGSAVTSIVSLFYTAPVNGEGGGFTFLGIITLVGIGCGLVYFALRLIYRAVNGVAR